VAGLVGVKPNYASNGKTNKEKVDISIKRGRTLKADLVIIGGGTGGCATDLGVLFRNWPTGYHDRRNRLDRRDKTDSTGVPRMNINGSMNWEPPLFIGELEKNALLSP